MFKIFIQNAALLVTLSFLYGIIKFYRPQKDIHFQLISGTWFGMVAIAAMTMPYQYQTGTIYDGRSVVLTLAGLWGGGIPTLTSIIISAAYRIYLGGTGVYAGIATIVFCATTGLIFRHYLHDKLYKIHFSVFLLIGVTTQLVMMACQLLLPGDPLHILKRIWVSILLVFPLVFAFIARLFQLIHLYLNGEQRIRAAEELYRTTLLSIGDAVICTDEKGKITQMNVVAENLTGWRFSEAKNKNLEEVFRIINEFTREKVENPVEKVLFEGSIVGLANHTLLISKNGKEIPIADSGAPIKNKNNQIIGVVLVFRDQAEEREQHHILEKSEAKYREREFWLRESQRAGQIGSYSFDLKEQQWTSSPVLKQIYGITQQGKLTITDFYLCIHPDQKEELREYFEISVLKKKQNFEKEYRIIRANDGIERWVFGRGELYLNDLGEPSQIIGIVQDITERKIFEQKLQESEERFRNAIVMAPIPIMVHDETGKILNMSEGWEHFSGYSINEIRDIKTWAEKTAGSKAKEVEEYIGSLYNKKETVFSGEFEIIAKNGTVRTWNFYHTPLGMIGGKRILLNIAPDITQRIRTKKELEESEFAYRLLFENHIAVKLLIDPEDGFIIKANQAAADFYGWSIEELQTMSIFDINCLSEDNIKAHMDSTMIHQRLNINFRHRLANGTERDVEIFSSRIAHKGKHVLHSIIHDVTDKNILMNELVEAKEKAEESERLKSAFLANVSHEIRTPLNGIVGFSNILAQEEDLSVKEKKEFAEIIVKSSEGLLKIINDILDISRLETGKAHIEEKAFNIGNMLENIHSMFQKRLTDVDKPYLKLQLIKPADNLLLKGDESRITQIFSNLIDNAIRFTHEGGITFGVSSVKETGIEFFVSDTGIGIEKEKQRLIFERFTQADSGTSRSYGGTGLGLAIVKKLLEMMNSEIHLESEPGEGTHFWFRVPYLTYVETEEQKPANQLLNGNKILKGKDTETKILIVEDDPSSLYFFHELLSKSYSNLLLAENGRDALKQHKLESPDIILIDIGLPDMSGLDVIREIRQTDPKVKIIVQTSYAMIEDERRAREAGCNDFFTKPVKAQILLEKLRMN